MGQKQEQPSGFEPQQFEQQQPQQAQGLSQLVNLLDQYPVQKPDVLNKQVRAADLFSPTGVKFTTGAGDQVQQAVPLNNTVDKKDSEKRNIVKNKEASSGIVAPKKAGPAVSAVDNVADVENTEKTLQKVSDKKVTPYKPQGVKSVPTKLTQQSKAIADGKELNAKEIKAERDDRHKANKETQKYYDQILAEDKAATNGDARLSRMEKLVDRGDLPNNTFYNLVEGVRNLEIKGVPLIGGLINAILSVATAPIGGGLRALEVSASPGTEEFEKLSADFVKDAKNYFGGRLTDADLKAYMLTVPTLAQSDGGKKALIRNMRSLNKIAHIRSDAMKEIVKERGYRPSDIALLVEDRAKPQIDALTAEFINPEESVQNSKSISEEKPTQGETFTIKRRFGAYR